MTENMKIPALRQVNTKTLDKVAKVLNEAVKPIAITDVTQLRKVYQATSIIACEIMNVKILKETSGRKFDTDPPWARRLKSRIQWCRKHISQLTRLRSNEIRDYSKICYLTKKFAVNPGNISIVIEQLKQQMAVYKHRLIRYTSRDQFYKQNKLFEENQKKFYASLKSKEEHSAKIDEEKMVNFWRTLWSKTEPINKNCSWMETVTAHYRNLREQEPVMITVKDIQIRVRKLLNWKAPGKDGIHNYWLKRLSNLHVMLSKIMNSMINEGDNETFEWLLRGNTTLIPKTSNNVEFNPNNYRPITCLSSMWKLFSGIISEKIYDHLIAEDIFPKEQKGCRKNVLGTKDQLLINKAITENAHHRKKNLSTCWIDYKKAYDSVPHDWLIRILKMLKVNHQITQFIKASMKHYQTTLICNNKEIGEVKIERGIYQGDSLSPILFVMALFPLSVLLSATNQGYKFNNTDQPISHLWFVDDLKLFSKNDDEMRGLVRMVETFSTDIKMSFGIDKCKWCQVKKGERVEADKISTEFGDIQNIGSQADPYKYLGVLEKERTNKEEMKRIVKSEYKRRIRLLMKTELNAKYLTMAINAYAVSVVRYSMVAINWTKEELAKIDRATRKLLAMNSAMDLNADVHRLYVPRKLGGKGLISIIDMAAREKALVSNYLKTHENDRLLKHCTQKRSKEITDVELNTKQLKELQINNHLDKWRNKKLHGKFFTEVSKQKVENFEWLRKGKLKKQTEAIIMAAQEESLRLKHIKTIIDHTINDPLCRACGQFNETVQHVTCGCPCLAKSDYIERHNRMGRMIHWALSMKWGFTTAANFYHHIPDPVLENSKCKILWDFPIKTDKTIKSQRPDLTLVDKENKTCLFIEFSVPFDYKVKDKIKEKLEKYQELQFEVRRIWELKKIKTIPIIIGALGSMDKEYLCNKLTELGIAQVITISALQKEVVLGTSKILRKHLSL
jgi:hypothetical protein